MSDLSEIMDSIVQAVDLPEGAVPNFGIAAVSYLDEEGVSSFGWALGGDPTEMQALGLLQMTSIKIILRGDDGGEDL